MDAKAKMVREALRAMPTCSGLAVCGFTPGARRQAVGADGCLELAFKRRRASFRVRVLARLYGAMIERVIAEAGADGGRPPLVVADHVSEMHGELLRKAGIAFLDTSGNASLELPGLQLLVLGRPRQASSVRPFAGRLFHRAGLRLVFAFLTDPAIGQEAGQALFNQPFRCIREQAGVALGSITAIMGELQAGGHVAEDGGVRWLVNRKQLLAKWATAYGERLRPRLGRRYRTSDGRPWSSDGGLPPGMFWGGEVAAAKLTGFLRPEAVCVYAARAGDDLVLEHDLRPDPGGNVEILDAFWGEWPHAVRGDCVHPLLVYADLLASDIDRNLDTAQRIYEQYLRQAAESR